jgi:hypothetical protein
LPIIHENNGQAEDIRLFLEEAEKLNQTGDRNNISAVLQVSVDANPSVYKKIEEEEAMNALGIPKEKMDFYGAKLEK